jgi:hypothetical protein
VLLVVLLSDSLTASILLEVELVPWQPAPSGMRLSTGIAKTAKEAASSLLSLSGMDLHVMMLVTTKHNRTTNTAKETKQPV